MLFGMLSVIYDDLKDRVSVLRNTRTDSVLSTTWPQVVPGCVRMCAGCTGLHASEAYV